MDTVFEYRKDFEGQSLFDDEFLVVIDGSYDTGNHFGDVRSTYEREVVEGVCQISAEPKRGDSTDDRKSDQHTKAIVT